LLLYCWILKETKTTGREDSLYSPPVALRSWTCLCKLVQVAYSKEHDSALIQGKQRTLVNKGPLSEVIIPTENK